MDRTVSFVAGTSYGPFRLHAPLLEVVRLLQNEATTFGTVEVQRSEADGLHGPVMLFLPRYQARLVFDGDSQKLTSVVVENLSGAGDVFYRGRAFCGPHFPATFSHVYDVLGPTFHGEITSDDHYVLEYPGMKIYFAIPHQYAHLFSNEDVHPTTLPNGTAPVAVRLVIDSPRSDKVLSPLRTVQTGDQLSVVIGEGLVFARLCERLLFGSSPQDAISLLGVPSSVFLKRDDRMQVHKPSRGATTTYASAAPVPTDYFLNLPLLGLDLLYSGLSHGLIKVVVHNPLPLHQSFLQVHRCRYSCVLPTAFWEPSTVLDNNTNWNWLQHQYKGTLPKPLISSTGCLNGAVMRLFCLHGLVVYVLPDGSIPQTVFFCPSSRCAVSETVSATVSSGNVQHQMTASGRQSSSPVERQKTASDHVASAPARSDESADGRTTAPTSPAAAADNVDGDGQSLSRFDQVPLPEDSPIPPEEVSGGAALSHSAGGDDDGEVVLRRPHDGWDDATPTEPTTESPPPPVEEEEDQQPATKKKKKSSKKKNPW